MQNKLTEFELCAMKSRFGEQDDGERGEMKDKIRRFLVYLSEDRNYSPNTIKSYEWDLNTFHRFITKELMDKTASTGRVDKFLILDYLRLRQKGGKRPSASYRNRRLAILKSFFGYLVREGAISENPTGTIEWAKVSLREPDFLTYQDVQKLLDHIETTATEFYRRRDLAIVTTFYHTGLRLNELGSLNVEQVDYDQKMLRGVQRKGGEHKNLVVNQEVLQAVARWLRQRETLDIKNEPALFVSDRRRRLSARSIQTLVAKYAQESGLQKRITPHTFRHSHCTEIQLRGASMKTAKELLNHAQIGTTERYSHSHEEAHRKAVNSLVEDSEEEKKSD